MSNVTEAEIVHAVREEMAVSLSDVVLRRTDLGSLERPAPVSIEACADVMARELGWDGAERSRQIRSLEKDYAAVTERLRGK